MPPQIKPVEIPNKRYFRIGEVAELAGVEAYVLRYWETEFKEIRPVKSRSRQRLYRREDLEKVLRVKQLLHQDGFTSDGARRKIRELSRPPRPSRRNGEMPDFLKRLREGLEELVRIIET